MTVYSVYIVSKAGGLIYNTDHKIPKVEVEQTFSYPLELVLECQNKKVIVAFGQNDRIKVGHTLLAINGINANGRQLEDGRDIMEIIENKDNYPLSIKFGRPKINTNEKIFLASMFHSLYAIASQLSPELQSSGIEVLETDTFKLYCYQTLTGIKFIVVTEPNQTNMESLFKRIYEVYADYALKNPFYSLEMPIRCELFDKNLHLVLDQAEKPGSNTL